MNSARLTVLFLLVVSLGSGVSLLAMEPTRSQSVPKRIADVTTMLFDISKKHGDCDKNAAFFIAQGAQVYARDSQGHNPLYHASIAGNHKIATLLTAELTKNLFTVCNAENDFHESAMFFIEQGAVVNAKNSFGLSSLHCAVFKGNLKIAKSLIDRGADTDAEIEGMGATSLWIACENKNINIVKMLIKKKANLEVRRKAETDSTALYLASELGHVEIVKELLKAGANKESKTSAGHTPLHIASENGHLSVVQLLVESGALVEVNDNEGVTPCHLASLAGREQVVNFLLKHNADVNAKLTFDKLTPLHAACENGHLSTVKLLVKHNANVNALDFQGGTPLMVASAMGCSDIVEFLIYKNACIDSKVIDSNATALHVACQEGNFDVVKILIKHKANTQELLWEKFTAIDVAHDYGNEDIVNFIEQHKNSEKFFAELDKDLVITKAESATDINKNPSKKKNVKSKSNPVKNSSLKQLAENKKQGVFVDEKVDARIKKDHIVVDEDCFVSLHDYEQRDKGGYCNEIFLFKSKNMGTHSQAVGGQGQFALIPVSKNLDNVGSQLVDNHVLNLKYSKHVLAKMENPRDIFHNFTINVEKKHGHLGCAIIKDSQIDAQRKAYLTKEFNLSENISDYWYEVHVTIPAQIRSMGFSEKKAQQQGPFGVFEFIILKKSLSDSDGLCVHRFFKKFIDFLKKK